MAKVVFVVVDIAIYCNDLKHQYFTIIYLEQTLESEKERLNGQLQQLKTEYQEKNDKLSAELTLTSKYQVTGDVLKTEIITLYLVNCLYSRVCSKPIS
jgi:hypothetical protein